MPPEHAHDLQESMVRLRQNPRPSCFRELLEKAARKKPEGWLERVTKGDTLQPEVNEAFHLFLQYARDTNNATMTDPAKYNIVDVPAAEGYRGVHLPVTKAQTLYAGVENEEYDPEDPTSAKSRQHGTLFLGRTVH